MTRTTISLPEDLEHRAQERARSLGVSLDELIQELLETRLGDRAARRVEDPLFAEPPVYGGEKASDLAAEHDRYLYGNDS